MYQIRRHLYIHRPVERRQDRDVHESPDVEPQVIGAAAKPGLIAEFAEKGSAPYSEHWLVVWIPNLPFVDNVEDDEENRCEAKEANEKHGNESIGGHGRVSGAGLCKLNHTGNADFEHDLRPRSEPEAISYLLPLLFCRGRYSLIPAFRK
jgi:hypothetical protein